jgi:uncharacterized peroxidase-related enzyme
MAFIDTLADGEIGDETRAMYDRQSAHYGYVPNYARVFCHRPHVMGLWAQLQNGIRREMDKRRFEIVTFAAAHALRSTLCTVAHGRMLASFIPAEDVLAIARGEAPGSLSPAECAIVAFTRKVARDATSVDAADVARLKEHGLTDGEIFDVAATSAARAFWTKLLDALGVEADAPTRALDAAFSGPLCVGRALDFDSRSVTSSLEIADQPIHHDQDAERKVEAQQHPQPH